jgi:hypothetical protein
MLWIAGYALAILRRVYCNEPDAATDAYKRLVV